MKTEQIKLMLAIAREKTLSKAADSLFISQPTASNMLKTLESELGYPIFSRTRGGMILTNEGIDFIQYAETIERSLNAIYQIQAPEKKIRFKVLSIKDGISEIVFEKLCEKYLAGDGKVDLCYHRISGTEDAIRMLGNGNGDVAIVLCNKSVYKSFEQNAEKRHIATTAIGEEHLEITCNKAHPLIREGEIRYDLLGKYTCFSGMHASSTEFYIPFVFTKYGVDFNNTVVMEPGDVRCRLIRKTNGFLISFPVPEEVKEKYGFESRIIQDSMITIFAAYRKDPQNEEMIREYIDLWKANMPQKLRLDNEILGV